MRRDFPAWMKKGISSSDESEVARILAGYGLNTVCREAACPNRHECYRRGTATFLVLGGVCTRNCAFCDIASGAPEPVQADEPARVAAAAAAMGLDYVVVTSVTRDDLPDGGAAHFAAVVRELRAAGVRGVEVLTPDFRGDRDALRTVLDARPDVFNHNVETVERLYPRVRPQADYRRSLDVLAHAAESGVVTKSGLMVGLGERPVEVLRVMLDLLDAGVQILTIGQYLSPGPSHAPVAEFVPPARFEWYARKAREFGFRAVASGVFVRSSYRAAEIYRSVKGGVACSTP